MAMTIVEAAAPGHGWRRHPPRGACRGGAGSDRRPVGRGAVLRRPRPATASCLAGWRGFGPVDPGRGGGHRLVWGGPGPVPAPRPASRWWRSTGRTAKPGVAREVRPGRRDRGGPSRARRAGPAERPRPATATSKRSGRWWSPSARAPLDADQDPQPDPPSQLHRPRRAAGPLQRLCPVRHRRSRRLRCGPRAGGDPVVFATKTALRTLGRRVLALDEETAALDALLAELVAADRARAARALRRRDRHRRDPARRRRRQPASGSAPKPPGRTCAASRPIEASSGKIIRHRLNRGGDRQANHALWRIVITRMSTDPRTRPTWSAAPKKAAPNPRSSACSSATSPARSSSTSSRARLAPSSGPGPIIG